MIIQFSNQLKAFSGPKWVNVEHAARILFNIKRTHGQIRIALILEKQNAKLSLFRFGLLNQKYEFGYGAHAINNHEITGGFFLEINGISSIAILGRESPTKVAGQNVIGHYWIEPVPCGPYSTPIFAGSIQES